MAKGAGVRVRSGNRSEQFHVGGVKQRSVDSDVRAIGGRSSKAYQAAKDFGSLSRGAKSAGVNLYEYQGAYPSGPLRGRQARAALEQVQAAAKRAGIDPKRILNASLRGMLSPAALTEGFASKAGSDQQKRKFMEQNRRENDKKSPVKRGKTTA